MKLWKMTLQAVGTFLIFRIYENLGALYPSNPWTLEPQETTVIPWDLKPVDYGNTRP